MRASHHIGMHLCVQQSSWFAMLLSLAIGLASVYCSGALSASGRTFVGVTQIVTVSQGRSVDLRGAFRLHYNLSSLSVSSCEVRQLSEDLCAEVHPQIFPCNYTGVVRFHHLGCSSSYEIVNLELLLHTTGGKIIAEIFSVPVHINIAKGAKPETSFDRKSGVLSLWFPTSLAGVCSYTVIHNHYSLPLPLFGQLTGGIIGQPLPCGMSPRDPLTYSAVGGNATEDFLLVRVDCLEQLLLSTHYVLPISASDSHSAPRIELLPDANLDSHELDELPLSPSLLPLDQLYSYPSTKLKIIFPVLHIGGLYPITAAHHGALDATTFTLPQLQQWKVTFRPNETSASLFMTIEDVFFYHVTDEVGNTIAKGSLLVKLHPKTGRRPSVRRNTGLTLRHGATSPLTSSNLDFYQIGICRNSTLRLEHAPSFGSFVSTGDSLALEVYNAISASALRNGSLLYNNNATTHRTELLDFSLWSLECSGHSVIKIPIVIRLVPVLAPCHLQRHNLAILALQDIATPLPAFSSAVSSRTRLVLSTSTGAVLKPRDGCVNERLSNSSSYPFIHISDLNLTACQPSKMLEFNTLTPVPVWFLPLGNKSATVIISTTPNNLDVNSTGCATTTTAQLTIQVQNSSLGVLLTHQQSREGISTPDATKSSLPNLTRNHPLPLISKDSVVITKAYLYIEPQGYLQNNIYYQVKTPPQHGILCSVYTLNCKRSILAFTQANIIANHLYYKPNSPSPMDDWFEFTFYTNNFSEPHNFTITRSKEVLTEPPRQFWVAYNKSKALAPKFLRHMIKHLAGKDIHFTVIVGPEHGWLETPTNTSSFHLRDSKNRVVTYHHNGDRECADSIFLEATDGQETLLANISIAIRHRSGTAPVPLMGKKLLQDSDSFIFNQEDLLVGNNFCPEFVLFEIVQLPGYGTLRVQDARHNITRHLEVNGKFSASDIQEGSVSYFLSPELIILQNTTDVVQMTVTQPGQKIDRRRSTSGIFRFEIFIIPGEGSGEGQTINFTTNSPKWLTQLDNNKYGAVFGPEDLHEWNAEIEPYEIVIHVSQQPFYGHLKRGPVPVGEFTLEDVYNGLISYESTISHQDRSVTSDEFRFTVIVDLEGKSRYVSIAKMFELQWCYFYVTNKQGSERNVILEESMGRADFIVRRTGPNVSLPVYVNFTTVPVDANGLTNCHPTANTNGDFCFVNKRITFSPGKSKLRVSTNIYNNTIAEGPEQFHIQLTHPEGCLLPRVPPLSVWIVDYEDYSTISFSMPQNSRHHRVTNRDVCKIEVTTKETVGVLKLNLTRSGNLNQSVGVICYTNTTHASSHGDYVERYNNASSLVYFQPGQKTAQCPVQIVNDNLNEPTDNFYVHLGEKGMEGFAFIDYSSTPVCVFITHDEKDVPLVLFNTTRIIVQERKDRSVLAEYTLKRTGTDLSSKSDIVLQSYTLTSDNATAGDDFVAGRTSRLVFQIGETLKTGVVEILPDNVREGTENFHIHIKAAFNAERGSPDVLEVVILDAFEDTVIGFTSPNFTFRETQGAVQIPFKRSGYVAVTSNITCILTPGSVKPFNDYILPPSFERVLLAPNITNAACNVYLLDNSAREGEEYFTVTLFTTDPGARLLIGRTKVIITDDEDIPTVTFTQSQYYVEEPLSNFPVDKKCVMLTLSRSGDSEKQVSVVLSTRPGTAHEGVDYTALNTVLQIPAGVNRVNTTVLVLANHNSQQDSTFTAFLSVNATIGTEVRLGRRRKARITIRQTVLKGVYFPALPLVGSQQYPSSGGTTSNLTFGVLLFYDNPLLCVTPCDARYESTRNYSAECARQQIDSSRTQFVWEVSKDGWQFTKLHQDTLFTSTRSKVLDPVYLEWGLHVRCIATPVDRNGVRGYPRVSQPVKLVRMQGCSQQSGVHLSTLTTYPGFRWRREDLLSLTIILPRMSNTIPLVTTKLTPKSAVITLLTYPASRQHHTCSNFVMANSPTGQHSLLSLSPGHTESQANLLYQHYDPTQCMWTFKTWIPLGELESRCGAVSTATNISVHLYVLYTSIHNNTVGVVSTVSIDAVMDYTAVHTSNQAAAPPPYNYFPIHSGRKQVFVHPISIEWDSITNSLIAILYSYTPTSMMFHSGYLANRIKRRSISSDGIVLLYSHHSGKQAWLMQLGMDRNQSTNIDLQFSLVTCVKTSLRSRCRPGHPFTFHIPLILVLPNNSTQKNWSSLTRILTHTALTAHISRLDEQERVLVDLELQPILKLRQNHSLTITEAWACLASHDLIGSKTRKEGCLQDGKGVVIEVIRILDARGSNATDSQFQAELRRNSTDAGRLGLLFTISSLQQDSTKPSNRWYLHIVYGVARSGGHVITEEHMVLLLQLQSNSSTVLGSLTPTQTTSEQQPPKGGEQMIPIYAMVLLSLALILLIVVCTVTGSFFCYSSRQRCLQKTKPKMPTQGDEESIISKTSKPASDGPAMTYTHSRKIRRSKSSVQLLMQKAAEISRQNHLINATQDDTAMSKCNLRRSHSLPDLTKLGQQSSTSSTAPVVTRYTIPTNITSNGTARVATVKPISHKRPTQSPTISNPQLTDETLDMKLDKWRKSWLPQPVKGGAGWYERHKSRQIALASYAQLYLAAGAKTPEPGVSPSTKL